MNQVRTRRPGRSLSRVAFLTTFTAAVAFQAAPTSAQTSEKRAFADYFSFLRTREQGGDSGTWQLYDTPDGNPANFYPQIRWSGDVYLTADRKEISGSFYPRIGPYTASDPDVLEYHVLSAIAAGLDGFVFEWFMTGLPLSGNCTPDTSQIRVTQAIFDYATFGSPFGFEVGVNWTCAIGQTYGCIGNQPRSVYLDQAAWDLDYLLDELDDPGDPSKPSGIHVDGRPLVLLFSANSASPPGTAFGPSDVQYLRNSPYLAGHDPFFLSRAGGPLDLGMLSSSGGTPGVDGFFSWKKYFSDTVFFWPWNQTTSLSDEVSFLTSFSASCLGHVPPIPYMMSAIPRFDDHKGLSWGSGHRRYLPSEDSGESLVETLATWPSADTDLAFVVTWNDEEEGTLVEPSREFGFSNLERCLEGVSTWKGLPAPTADAYAMLRWPERLFKVRKAIRLVQKAIDRSPVDPPQALLDQLDAVIDSADAASTKLGNRDVSALADLTAAESAAGVAIAMLRVVRIDATWQYDDTTNPAIHSCSAVTVWPTPALDGKQGAKVSATNQLWLDLVGDVGDAMSSGAFVGRATVELIESDDGLAESTDWLWVTVDAPLGLSNLTLTRRSKESGTWNQLQFDLVNGQWGNSCSTGADIRFVTFNTTTNDATTAVRRLRIEGFAYQVQ